jgi:hypothetical protein
VYFGELKSLRKMFVGLSLVKVKEFLGVLEENSLLVAYYCFFSFTAA